MCPWEGTTREARFKPFLESATPLEVPCGTQEQLPTPLSASSSLLNISRRKGRMSPHRDPVQVTTRRAPSQPSVSSLATEAPPGLFGES